MKKIIHYCWFGGKNKPESVLKMIDSWKKFCPDYKIIEWNEENFNLNSCDYVKEAYETNNYAFVSDFARIKVLYEYGGVYLDTDVELIGSLDKFINSKFCVGFQDEEYINTGLIIAEKGNKILMDILNYYENRHFLINGKCDRTSNPVIITEILKKYGLIIKNQNQFYDNLIIYANDYFCPLDYKTKKLNKTINTACIHWFDGSWLTANQKRKLKIKKFLKKIIGEKIYDCIKELKIKLKKILIIMRFNFRKLFYKVFYKTLIKRSDLKKSNLDINEARNFISSIRNHDDVNVSDSLENTIDSTLKYDLMIVVPMYNSESTIKNCIYSILNQKTKYSFIVKVVNDGSTDSGADIIKKINDERIILINQKNQGRSAARNKGIEKILGKYVMFVDSDDTLSEDCVEILLDEAEKNNYDIVEGLMNYIKNNKIIKKELVKSSKCLTGYPFNKVYKSKIWLNNYYLPNYEYEDTINKFMIYPIYNNVKKIAKYTYNYYINENGITQKSLFSNISVDSFLITEFYINKVYSEKLYNNALLLKLFLEQIIVNFKRTRYMNDYLNECIFVLTSELFTNYFSDVSINSSEFKKYGILIKALKAKNYQLFKIFCVIN